LSSRCIAITIASYAGPTTRAATDFAYIAGRRYLSRQAWGQLEFALHASSETRLPRVTAVGAELSCHECNQELDSPFSSA